MSETKLDPITFEILSHKLWQITEEVEHSWYDYPPGSTSLHPSVGVTEFNPRKNGAYSFIKAPRYSGLPMEVGPLARGLVNQYPELMEVIKQYVK